MPLSRRHAYRVSPPFTPSVPGRGPVGAATFVLSLQPGTRVIYSWSTDIFRSFSGIEQRSSPFGTPKQRFEGTAFLLEASSRDIRSTLQRAAAAGSTFLLALPYEEALLVADAAGTTVTVASTAVLDWAQPGQRCVVIGSDGTALGAVVQSTMAATITLAVVDSAGNLTSAQTLGSAGRTGGRILPLVQVLLDPQQGFARYPISVDLWALRAQAAVFGWGGVDVMGAGASIVTYSAGAPVPVAELVEADLLIWDRPNAIEGTASEAMLSGAETLDLGALPSGFGDQHVPDWARPIRFASSDPDDWQWLKAFLRKIRGRQVSFLLSTNRDDLIYLATTPHGAQVQSADVAGAGDYASWFASLAHQRLAVATTDGDVQYVTVTGLVDHHDGTLSLSLDRIVLGTIAKLSLVEQVRLEDSDDHVAVTWDGGTFSVELVARTSEETLVPPNLLLFDTVIDLALTGAGPPAQEFVVVLGKATLIHWTSDRTRRFNGIAMAGGPVHGTIVTIINLSSGSAGLLLVDDDPTVPPTDRLWNAGRVTFGAVGLVATYRYHSGVGRWVQIA